MSDSEQQGPIAVELTPLGGARVRGQVTVAAAEVERALEAQARKQAGRLRLPGFRKGRVPPELALRQLGRETLLREVISERLGGWYARALLQARVDPIGDPKLELDLLPAPGEDLKFSFEVAVLPGAKLGKYKQLEVGRRQPQADPQEVEAELEAIRARSARLADVEREAQAGDYLVVDYRLFAGGRELKELEGRDELFELGGSLLGELERALLGARAGEERRAQVRFPDDHPDRRLRGREVEFALTVKAVRERVLPDLDDGLAADVGFDTLEQLKAEVERLVEEADLQAVEREFREAALDAAVEQAKVDLPEGHVQARAEELWENTRRRLAARGIGGDAYLRLTGTSEQELLERTRPYAELTLKREAVLAAIVAAEGIEPTDQEVAQAAGIDEGQLELLRTSGELEELRDQLAAARALDLLVETAKPIEIGRARAREKLWTPERGEPGAEAAARPGALWTPSSSR